jgi:hypothetical protein
MRLDDRARALVDLGFNLRRARFLTVAALHSGYFVRRQYTDWAGITSGCATAAAFFDTLVRRGFAQTFTVRRDRGLIYHLTSPRLYAALGEPEHPNRRPHTLSSVLQRVMALDFVLRHPEYEHFATAREKERLVVEEYGVAPERLPVKRYLAHRTDRAPVVRCFIEGLPVFRPGGDSVVCIGYPFAERTAVAFGTFVRRYLPLLEALPRAVVVLIVPRGRAAPAAADCARVFEQLARGGLLRHFRDRAAWERGDYATFPAARVWQLRQDEQRYASEAYQALYRRWQVDGDAALSTNTAAASAGLPTLEVYHLPHTYEQFGSWAAY